MTAERRSPTGIARKREISADDAALCQREGRITFERDRSLLRPSGSGLFHGGRGRAGRPNHEAALAHVNTNRIEAAYRHTDMFERRRTLMEQWAAFLGGAGDNRAVPPG